MAVLEKVDVVIVGAGMSGAIFAAVLSRAGKKVAVLEQGRDWNLTDLVSNEIWGRRIKAINPAILEGKEPVGYGYNSGWGMGGAGLHFFGSFPRMLPSDLNMKSEHGHGFDWPISYEELSAYYDKVMLEVGVAGDAEAEKRWRTVNVGYPMPPLQTFGHSDVWVKGFDALGMAMVPAPLAINSVEFKGRPACIYDGWCNAGCPTGALANPLVTYLAEALKNGAEVRPYSTVTRVLTNPSGERVTAVEYYDRNKERQVQEARVVILAAFISENPRILFNSATDKHPKGLSNTSGSVGQGVMTHGASTIWGLFDHDLQNFMGIAGAQRFSYDRYEKRARKDAFGSTLWHVSPALKPNDIGGIANTRNDLFGAALDEFLKRSVGKLARLQAFSEEVPNPENRVVLSGEKDELGIPTVRISHTFDDDLRGLWRHANEEGLQAAKLAGAKEAWNIPAIGPVHIIGGCRMGRTAGDSIVNSYGQSHEITNLYLAGVSIFPTEGAVHPSNTLHAISQRGAEHVVANWGSIAG
jgi:choline dehydrogenase-like flavoprotein